MLRCRSKKSTKNYIIWIKMFLVNFKAWVLFFLLLAQQQARFLETQHCVALPAQKEGLFSHVMLTLWKQSCDLYFSFRWGLCVVLSWTMRSNCLDTKLLLKEKCDCWVRTWKTFPPLFSFRVVFVILSLLCFVIFINTRITCWADVSKKLVWIVWGMKIR